MKLSRYVDYISIPKMQHDTHTHLYENCIIDSLISIFKCQFVSHETGLIFMNEMLL